MTYNEIMLDMDNHNILSNPQVTFDSYIDDLIAFQDYMTAVVLQKEGFHKVDETANYIEDEAWKKGLQNNSDIQITCRNLRRVGKELAISIAGKKGEDKVARKISEATRDDMRSFRNVYVFGENEESEIDNIVLTKNGIIIIEVKNISTDVTISENGMLLVDKDVSYQNASLGEKMNKKRELLRREIEIAAKKRGICPDFFIDSLLVFCAPQNTYINDHYHKEKYCFASRVPYIIDSFVTRTAFSEEEFEQLNEILEELSAFKKTFTSDIDYRSIKDSFAKAYVKLFEDNAEAVPKTPVLQEPESSFDPEPQTETAADTIQKGFTRRLIPALAVAAVVIIGTAMVLIRGKKAG